MGLFDRIADSLGDLVVPDEVRMHLELGASALERGELELAIRELSEALALRPGFARAAYLLGVARARAGNAAGAEAAFADAIAARPELGDAHLGRGEARRRLGQLDTALESFQKAITIGVSSELQRGEVYRGRGAIYFVRGELDRSIRELRKAVAGIPHDTEAEGLLGQALLRRGDLDGARRHLERSAAAATADVATLCALGELYRRLHRTHDAQAAYERSLTRASEGERLTSRLGLAALAIEMGDAAGAHVHAMAALSERPSAPEAHLVLARARALARSESAALDEFDRAIAALSQREEAAAAEARATALTDALRVALRAGETERTRAGSYAAQLLADAANQGGILPADALAARALELLTAGDREEARATLASASTDSLEVQLAHAQLAIADGDYPEALSALHRAIELQPADARGRALLGEIYRRQVPSTELPSELPAVLHAVQSQFALAPEWSDLAPEAARLVELVDRPLLVTVMGEFNAGKSSFINALLGEAVAPTGITPTTATINVLKYGAKRGGRLLYLDGRIRELPWEEMGPLLARLSEAEVRQIRWVELFCPLPALERVNLVDTPGLNSILPEHEETARQFIAQADAVVWLFSVGQAGKASERAALERIRSEHKRILGVVNKIDAVGEAERSTVLAHLSAELGQLVEVLVPFSAREALHGQAERANRAELERVLEERFFSRAELIKRESALRRLGTLLAEAGDRTQKLLASDRSAEFAAAIAAVRTEEGLFLQGFLSAERLRLSSDLEALFALAAREVLEFVRPRSWVFGSHRATDPDRDFLVGLVEEQLRMVGRGSQARVVAELERIATMGAPLGAAQAGPALHILDEQVYGRLRAFVRGYLRGGRVDEFFTHVLPKLELSEAAVRRALERDMPNLAVVEAELLEPLHAGAAALFADLTEQLERLRGAEELQRYEIEERLLAPLQRIEKAFVRLQ